MDDTAGSKNPEKLYMVDMVDMVNMVDMVDDNTGRQAAKILKKLIWLDTDR